MLSGVSVAYEACLYLLALHHVQCKQSASSQDMGVEAVVFALGSLSDRLDLAAAPACLLAAAEHGWKPEHQPVHACMQVLHPAIEEMFAHEVWAHWDDALKLTCWHEQEMQDFAAKAATWQQERAVIAAEKQTKLREEGRI